MIIRIKDQIKRFILEDAPQGDLTSQGIIPEPLKISAKMIAAENFIFCGQHIIPHCFPSSCQIKLLFKDGNQIFKDDIIAIIIRMLVLLLAFALALWRLRLLSPLPSRLPLRLPLPSTLPSPSPSTLLSLPCGLVAVLR